MHQHERAPHVDVESRAFAALGCMSLHTHKLDPGEGVVHKGTVKNSEL